jgi:hypothetical protein
VRKWPLFKKSGENFFEVGPGPLKQARPSSKKFFASFFQKRSLPFPRSLPLCAFPVIKSA